MVRYLGKLSQTPTHHTHQTPGLSATARALSRTRESGTTWTTGVAGPRLPRNTVSVLTCTTETLRPLQQRSASGLAACGTAQVHRCQAPGPLVSPSCFTWGGSRGGHLPQAELGYLGTFSHKPGYREYQRPAPPLYVTVVRCVQPGQSVSRRDGW